MSGTVSTTGSTSFSATFTGLPGYYTITSITLTLSVSTVVSSPYMSFTFNGVTYECTNSLTAGHSKTYTFSPVTKTEKYYSIDLPSYTGSGFSCKDQGNNNTTVSGVTLYAGSVSFVATAGKVGTVVIGRSPSSCYYGQTLINAGTGSTSRTYAIAIGSANRLFTYATSPTSGLTATSSDRRDKADFNKIDRSLEFVNALEPVTFVDNHRDNYIVTKMSDEYDENGNQIEVRTFDEEGYNNQLLKGHRRIAGFIAQDVYQTLKDVYQDDNYASIVDYSKYDDPDNEVDRYYMRYTQLIPFLTGAIQELSKEIDTLKATINELKSQSTNQ